MVLAVREGSELRGPRDLPGCSPGLEQHRDHDLTMNEVLRQRLARQIDALPDEQAYQVLDFIEFLTSKYARGPVRAPASSLLRFGERLEDKMRAQGVAVRAMRGALDAVSMADRVVAGISEAGRSIVREVNEGLQAEQQVTQRALPPSPRAVRGESDRNDPEATAG
jgi:hypothetical protein